VPVDPEELGGAVCLGDEIAAEHPASVVEFGSFHIISFA
jgi:hypothetical protein